MSSHPGTTMNDAVEMAVWLKRWGYLPEQVQDFYPTPGTISTVMYYTGIHPMTGKHVYVTTDYREKQLQRALLQYSRPENANLVREALRMAGREDLIGRGADCLVRPAFGAQKDTEYRPRPQKNERSRAASHKGARANERRSANTQKPTRASKLDRVFGEDAARIRREAMRMADGKGNKAAKSTKNGGKSRTKK